MSKIINNNSIDNFIDDSIWVSIRNPIRNTKDNNE